MNFVGNAVCDGRRLRAERLNAHWFLSMVGAKLKIEASRRYHDEVGPHTALDRTAPVEFARRGGLELPPAGSKEPEISNSEGY